MNTTIVHNTYNETVINNTTVVNRVSYNGGPAGVHAVATAQESVALHRAARPPTSVQTQHVQAASQNHALLASVNRGHPAVAATPHAGNFSGPGVMAAHQAAPGANHPGRLR